MSCLTACLLNGWVLMFVRVSGLPVGVRLIVDSLDDPFAMHECTCALQMADPVELSEPLESDSEYRHERVVRTLHDNGMLVAAHDSDVLFYRAAHINGYRYRVPQRASPRSSFLVAIEIDGYVRFGRLLSFISVGCSRRVVVEMCSSNVSMSPFHVIVDAKPSPPLSVLPLDAIVCPCSEFCLPGSAQLSYVLFHQCSDLVRTFTVPK